MGFLLLTHAGTYGASIIKIQDKVRGAFVDLAWNDPIDAAWVTICHYLYSITNSKILTSFSVPSRQVFGLSSACLRYLQSSDQTQGNFQKSSSAVVTIFVALHW